MNDLIYPFPLVHVCARVGNDKFSARAFPASRGDDVQYGYTTGGNAAFLKHYLC